MGMGEWSRGPTIGRGSSATVSLATASLTGEVFAVKSTELSRSALLQREQRILSALNSPNIISSLGSDITTEATPDRRVYYNLFMEYAHRGSLSDHIRKQGGRLDELAIRFHTHQILTGLAYLHSHRLVHCDIKGTNILIGSDGRTKIADLGCARWIEDEHQMSGTPMFMAPEVARGEDQGPESDVWAVGCTIIEMATGRPPWPDVPDPISALHRIAFSSDVPESPSWISEEGKDFLRKCLSRDPKERWSADQLLRHPFMIVPAASHLPKSDQNHNWTSPKSTLDQDLWESLSEEDDDQSDDDPPQRIRQLLGEYPNWMWGEEDWVTIRSNGEECPTLEEDEMENSAVQMITSMNIPEDFIFESYNSSDNNIDRGKGIEQLLSICIGSVFDKIDKSRNHKHAILLLTLCECFHAMSRLFTFCHSLFVIPSLLHSTAHLSHPSFIPSR